MCNRRANWSRHNQLGRLKVQPSQIAYFRRLSNGKDDSERADYEAATKGEDQQQPNGEVRELDYTFADNVTASDYVGNAASD
jgi:hypothetical protein